ncbi:hypothetical protein KCMC57_64300 (plasmid) [Kitasatospora sp. CMC57]|uniref:Uncharacterized protein n=1 Tax=Kitasatospora sp. CMC57 TaxID=3231513 RepID=A0AB33KC43_9ACTN
MADTLDGLSLAEVRRELALLVAMADSAERPKPDLINPPGHAMPGHEWRVDQRVLPGRRPPLWIVRTVDDEESRDFVYVAEPDPHHHYDWLDKLDFGAMLPIDARRLAMALLAAADRADHLTAGVTRLEDRRPA